MSDQDLVDVSVQRLASAERVASDHLLSQRTSEGHWVGELSISALSTATATMALWQYRRAMPAVDRGGIIDNLIAGGRSWLLANQNDDGGWGDTLLSLSNISTTMLAQATLVVESDVGPDLPGLTEALSKAGEYIDRAGGVEAVMTRYGRDRTFSVPILTHCALAGTVEWSRVIPLPFELACLPHRFYKAVRLPVVSYALPALIAIGLARFNARPPRNPVTRIVRRLVRGRVLKILERIQPPNGGFLEAAPLTSFVTMSLVSVGHVDHIVTRRAVEFLVDSVRDDGGWPIDTNLATWVTTLSVNALGDRLGAAELEPIRRWLGSQQSRGVHPYTNADPGGWSWTDLPGGVPDADDTSGAILAMLAGETTSDPVVLDSVEAAAGWLLSLQNRDGGWPTFCRGWGALAFDRSSPDISGHVLRALQETAAVVPSLADRIGRACRRGFGFLRAGQRDNGSWIPLWFGNEQVANDENPVFGTARVLAAWRAAGLEDDPAAVRARNWLIGVQNSDGGWGGDADTPSSVEETALAVEALLGATETGKQAVLGLEWLIERVESGTWFKTSPIGFYFARLWYFEKLYPLIFTVGALRLACQITGNVAGPSSESERVGG